MRLSQARAQARMGRTAAWLVVVLGALVMASPLYFMLVFATQGRAAIFSAPPPLFFGDHLLRNVHLLVASVAFWHDFGLSLYVAAASTVLTLLFCSMGGYAFAMFEFPGKRALFLLLLATMLVPQFMNMIPTFMVMDALRWINRPRALYVPGAASAFGILLMRQYIGSAVPPELISAARLDGCGELGIYWRIVLPLIGPALGTLGLISFIASWNNFLLPLIVMRTPSMYTLPLALRSLQNPVDTQWGALMAGAAIATLPLLVVFAVSSRRLVDGLTQGAVK